MCCSVFTTFSLSLLGWQTKTEATAYLLDFVVIMLHPDFVLRSKNSIRKVGWTKIKIIGRKLLHKDTS